MARRNREHDAMEEQVGWLWHRWVTGWAGDRHPQAAVSLEEMARRAGVMFRAAGGDPGLQLQGGVDLSHTSRRSWRLRLAGLGGRVPRAWRDTGEIHLPQRLDLYADPELNRGWYRWMAALLATQGVPPGEDAALVFCHWRDASAALLERMPGLRGLYTQLVSAHLQTRPLPPQASVVLTQAEAALRAALQDPWSRGPAPHRWESLWPVPLWPHPRPPLRSVATAGSPADEAAASRRDVQPQPPGAARQAQRHDQPQRDDGLLVHRFESLFSWAERVRINRPSDEEDDESAARRAADDMETLQVSRSGQVPRRAFRFDLDLPAEALDDRPLGPGVRLPEWDWRRERLMPDHCLVIPMESAAVQATPLPARLRLPARRLQSALARWRPDGFWQGRRTEGTDLDLDACVARAADLRRGDAAADGALWREYRRGSRDLACLLLADLSLSTDAWLDDHQRVIDVIRDSLFLFSEALSAAGDRFALYGFSSLRRDHVRFLRIKDFSQPCDHQVRGRLAALKPGYYTRLGAALRQATRLLQREGARQRLLLLLSDGKPHDLDHYEGRYGMEDTRRAVREAREAGLRPFCVSIDQDAGRYAARLFGSGSMVRVHRPQLLPEVLPQIYLQLTRE
ncbi:MAG: VWA domain-containing protein [Magnetococcus sp. WYHC-3]